MARGQGSWAGADPEAAPPPIARRLHPGEALLWSSGAGGPRILAHSIGLPLAIAAGIGFSLWAPPTDNPYLHWFELGFISLWCAWSAWLGLRGLFETAFDIYAITDRRVMVIRRLFPSITYSLAARGTKGCTPITRLRVTGGRARGDVSLRGFGLSGAPTKLFGIEQPAEVAAYINAALHLGLKIDDRTR